MKFEVIFRDGTKREFEGSWGATEDGVLTVTNPVGRVITSFHPGEWARVEREGRLCLQGRKEAETMRLQIPKEIEEALLDGWHLDVEFREHRLDELPPWVLDLTPCLRHGKSATPIQASAPTLQEAFDQLREQLRA